MATTVVSVVIFLCGVLVGRGVRAATRRERGRRVATAAAATSTPRPPAAAAGSRAPRNAPAAAAETELTYRKRLRRATSAPETNAEGGSRSRTAGPRRCATDPKRRARATRTAAPPATRPPPTPAPATRRAGRRARHVGRAGRRAPRTVPLRRRSSSGWQARAIRRSWCDPQPGAPAQVYKVQVGTYNDRAEAEQVSAAPQEGRAVRAPGFCASAPLGRPARAELSEVRPSRLRLARADAALVAAGAPSADAGALRRAFFLGLDRPAPSTSPARSTGWSRR